MNAQTAPCAGRDAKVLIEVQLSDRFTDKLVLHFEPEVAPSFSPGFVFVLAGIIAALLAWESSACLTPRFTTGVTPSTTCSMPLRFAHYGLWCQLLLSIIECRLATSLLSRGATRDRAARLTSLRQSLA